MWVDFNQLNTTLVVYFHTCQPYPKHNLVNSLYFTGFAVKKTGFHCIMQYQFENTQKQITNYAMFQLMNGYCT